ncbi:MAG: right-handed parallel beta-helix repeat-containing protein [Eubacterium sp.]|nr:right-handed parallel beta-helix repeat-containing protein [Eubacterium sp.]
MKKLYGLLILGFICLCLPQALSVSAAETKTASTTITTGGKSSSVTGASVTYSEVEAITVEGLSTDKDDMSENAEVLQGYLDNIRDNQVDGTIYRLIIPKGTYYINQNIYIYSNTWLDMTAGATFKRGASKAGGFRCGLGNEEEPTGYSSVENVIIDGGEFNGNISEFNESNSGQSGEIVDDEDSSVYQYSMFRLGHAKNVIFRGVNFNGDVNGHHLEICSCANISVTNCTFQNSSGSKIKEAIQIEVAHDSSNSVNCKAFDDTICKNILIYNNTFKNVTKGIGNHFTIYGIYNNRILIKNNTFTNVYNAAINPIGCKNVTIEGNTMTNVGRGVVYTSNSSNTKVANDPSTAKVIKNINLVIKNNTIKTSNSNGTSYHYNYAIYVCGTEYNNSVDPIEGVTITGNTISSYDVAIYLSYVSKSTIKSNKVTNILKNSNNSADGKGIVVKDSSNYNTISSNKIGSSSSYAINGSGIYVESSKGLKITSNKIYKTTNNGIYIGSNSQATLKKNTVKYTKSHGLKINKATSVSDSYGTYKGCKKDGIYIYASTVKLQKDTCKSNTSSGIGIDTSSTVSIYKSKIISNGVHGISVDGATKVKIGKKSNGNTIQSNAEQGICVRDCTSKTVSIAYNSIKKNKKSGIGVYEKSVVSVQENSIKSNKTNGVSICESTAKVYNNTIKDNKAHGVSTTTAKSSTVIGGKSKGNVISDNGGYGIVIAKSSNVKISSNTCQNNDTGVYVGTQSKATVKKNKMKSNSTGLEVAGSGKVTATENKITENTGSGVVLVNTSKAVKVKNNTLSNKGSYEIYKSSSSDSSDTIKKVKLTGIKKNSKTIEGKTLANVKVTLYVGKKKIGKVKTDEDGKFTFKLKKKLKKGKTIKVKLKDASGNSILRTIVVK